jgi:hypothetical protein
MTRGLERKVGALRGVPGGGEDADAVRRRIFYINLKLRDLGCPTFPVAHDAEFADLVGGLMASHS